MKKEGKKASKKAAEATEDEAAKEFSSDDVFSGLSAETIKALREFALESGVAIVDDEEEPVEKTLLSSVQKHFQIQDREEVFHLEFKSADGTREVKFDAKGIKRELGQTLQSTGLTMYGPHAPSFLPLDAFLCFALLCFAFC